MKFGITPCPNDTFTYRALIEKRVENDFDFVFDDIEGLNLSAEKGEYEITKLSFAAFLKNRDKYQLLDAGAALGIGTGPVLVARNGVETWNPQKPILVPGENTTAALLLKFYAKQNIDMRPMMFRKIIDAIKQGVADYGVLIHEGRFVLKESNLRLDCDLGEYWTNSTSLPVPLGCICVRKDFADKAEFIDRKIRDSLEDAFSNPEDCYPFVKKYAQYLSDDVLHKHIYAFVNEYSKSIKLIRKQLLESLEKC